MTLARQEKKNNVKLKSTWKEKGVMIVSDSWSDPLRNPWINFIDTFGCGHVFLKAKNCSSEIKDKFFIGKFMKKVIHQMDDQNIV